MQIVDVSAYAVRVGLRPLSEGGIAPYKTNHNAESEKDRVVLRVETDTGVVGWGEMRPFLSAPVTVDLIEDGIAPLVVGKSPFDVESLRRQMFIEYANVDMFFAGVEIACWDIIGKHLGRPVYELLGGTGAIDQTEWLVDEPSPDPRDGVEVAYCLGILPPEESRSHAARVHEAGYSVLKTKAGRDWQQDVDRIVAMDDEVDGALDFRLDPNQGWRVDEAVRVGASLADQDVYLQYLEQPIRVNAHDMLASLRERTQQPIAPNEDTYIANNLRSMIDKQALDVAVVDMVPMGGISGLRQLAAIATDAGIPLAHHCAFDLGIKTAAIAHAVTGIPGFSLPPDCAYSAWEDDIIEEPFVIEDGRLPVRSEPGLGIVVDESKLETYAIAE